MEEKQFFFIAVNYNNSKYTIAYIESVLLFNDKNVFIVIVDNDSIKEDIDALVNFCEGIDRVSLILNKENIGYFKALNVGIKSINRKDEDFVIIGNNDLIFESDFINNLEKYKMESDTLVIAPNIIRLDGVHQNPHIIYKYNNWHRYYRAIYYKNYYTSIIIQKLYNLAKKIIFPQNRIQPEGPIEIFSGYGACYVLTPHFFSFFKELDAPLFLMWEEAFLTNQVRSVKGKIIYLPTAIVNHHDHTSISKISGKTMFNYTKEGYIFFKKECIYANK